MSELLNNHQHSGKYININGLTITKTLFIN
jgi:hypothetical protein